LQSTQLLHRSFGIANDSWLHEIVDANKPVLFLDTDLTPAEEFRTGDAVRNDIEAILVYQITLAMATLGVNANSMVCVLRALQLCCWWRRVDMRFNRVSYRRIAHSYVRFVECCVLVRRSMDLL
jgi:hypothetical protein